MISVMYYNLFYFSTLAHKQLFMPTITTKHLPILIAVLFTFMIMKVNAQSDTNTSFKTRMNYIVQLLEKNRIPNGMLLDYAMEFTNLSNFDGQTLTDSNKVMQPEFWEIYNTLYTSRIHTSGNTIQNPAVLDSAWYNQRMFGKIVLAGLLYNYSKFRDDAASANFVTIVNDQVKDMYVNGVWQNPYLTQKVFAMSPSTEIYEGKNLQVLLPVNLWQTNSAGEVNNINVDFNDGLGYRTITAGVAVNLSYADTGLKVWKFRLQLTNSQYLYSQSQVKISNEVGASTSCSSCRFGTTNPETIAFTADEAYLGTKAQGYITIRYRDADRGLRRPLIVVEGFDAGHITKPELKFGSNNIEDFIFRNVATSGSNALNDILINAPQYDIIYVDWKNGTDYLQRNGYLLETIVRWVNANKEALPGGSFADNVVIGQSMGGVISRWALRDMETRLAQQHKVRMFISDDAPQQGANAPVAYQHLARHAKSFYVSTGVSAGIVETFQFLSNGPSPFRILSLADRPAARQMLINYVNGSGNIDNKVHTQWQTELKNMGYPSQNGIRNIAISNGTECGNTQPFGPGATMLNVNGKASTRFLGDILGTIVFPVVGTLINKPQFYLGILPGKNEIKYEFIANAQPPTGVSQQIYKGKISYTKKFLWVIPVTVTLTDRSNNSNTSLLPLDYFGGGQIVTGIDPSNTNFQNALIKFNLNFSHIPTFCFVPTPSALDIGLNNTVLSNADYLARYIGGLPPIAPKNSPFVNFVTAFNGLGTNEQHIGFFNRNGNWLAAELGGNTTVRADCSALCGNANVLGKSTLCTSEIYNTENGAIVNWSVSPAGVVTPPNPPTGSSTTINRITDGTVTLTATVTSACGDSQFPKVISVGAPALSITTSQSPTCNNGYKTYTLTAASGSGSNWLWSVGYLGTNSQILIFNPNSPSTMVDVKGGGTVKLNYTDLCGAAKTDGITVYASCPPSFVVAPNPAVDEVTITASELSTTARTSSPDLIYSVKILNRLGGIRKSFEYKTPVKSVSLSINELETGIYSVSIFNGTTWNNKKLIVQRR